jgi:peptidoglycan hydrolase-like protein with peptidoglycan-binding domain
MRRVLTVVAAAATMLAGGVAVTTATASAADSVGWCDGTKSVKITTSGSVVVRQPYHKGTGSRNCTLAEGAEGGAVVTLQIALKSCNFASNLDIDGDFGAKTKQAVSYAQAKRGTGVDGIYGPNTRRAFYWPTYSSTGNPLGGCLTTN